MYINIIGLIKNKMEWTNTEKKFMVDKYCSARGYLEEYDELGELIQTKNEFMNNDIMDYIKIIINAQLKKEAVEAVTFDEITFD